MPSESVDHVRVRFSLTETRLVLGLADSLADEVTRTMSFVKSAIMNRRPGSSPSFDTN